MFEQAAGLHLAMHTRAMPAEPEEAKRKLDTNDDKEENMKYKGEAYLPMVVNVLYAPKNGESGEFIARHSLPENSPLDVIAVTYARVQFLTEEDCHDPEIIARMLNTCSKLPSTPTPSTECIMDDANEVGALATTVSLLDNLRNNQP